MNHKIKSLNDLTIALHEINKKFRINDFVEEYRKAIGESSSDILTQLKQDGLNNPFQKIVSLSSKVSEQDLEKLMTVGDRLTSKYNYADYLDECQNLRDAFLKDRKNYFSSKVTRQPAAKKDEISSIFDLSGTTDIILADFIDKALSVVHPNHLDIVYEDLNGNRVKTKIRHRPAAITQDHVEAPLIDRYHGINAYDTFLLRSYYDIKKTDWVYIPIRLIVSLTSEEDISNMLDLKL
jgi:hypothetical protein